MNSIKRIKYSLLLLCSSLLLVGQSAQRNFDHRAFERYASHPDYAYMHYRKPPPTIWEQIIWFLKDLFIEFWSNPINSRLTLILFVVVTLAVALYWFWRMRFSAVLTSAAKKVNSSGFTEYSRTQTDYLSQIDSSLEERDYRSAIRFLFLQSLIVLARHQRIRLADWKTPYDYQMELSGVAIDPYQKFCIIYESAWYGDREVKRADFDKCRNYFEMLEETIG